MLRALLLASLFLLPSQARAQSAGPSLTAMPDEPPMMAGAPDAITAHQAEIEALAVTDPARPARMLELADAYRSLGSTAAEIRTLARIVQDHASAPDADRVQYRLARALERDHQRDRARAVWMHVIRTFPTSSYMQAAYVSFGDAFFAAGELDLAQQSYEQALRFAGGRWTAYAEYRLAWTLARRRDPAALQHIARAQMALGTPQLGAPAIRAALATDQGPLSTALHASP